MNPSGTYTFDADLRVWSRTDASDFAYSDGDATEEYLLRAVKSAADRRSDSDELASWIRDWPSEYHLSPTRANLLRPFDVEGLEVLEIGAGCGAITRYLADSGASVLALEGSLRRASIAAERCRDTDSVRVICDDFLDFHSQETFDLVLAVGVLEYAPSFFPGPDPVAAFIAKARTLLRPAGVLVVAIENQLGLKYFSGCSEDHSGRLFAGLEDSYQGTGVVTFGKAELTRELAEGGLPTCTFYYPFPDYKLPRLLLTDEALHSKRLDVGRLLTSSEGRDYGQPRLRLFREGAVWPVIARNGLTGELANSFLVLAAAGDGATLLDRPRWLARAYSTDRRKPFRTLTSFEDVDGRIVVRKERLSGEDLPSAGKARLTCDPASEYVEGDTLRDVLVRRLAEPDLTVQDFADALSPWIDYLLAHAELTPSDAAPTVPGRFIDCVPQNLVLSSRAREPRYIDAEWDFLAPVRPERPFVRGILHLALETPYAPLFTAWALRELLLDVSSRAGLALSSAGLDEILADEAEWMSETMRVDAAAWLQSTLAFIDETRPSEGELGAGMRRLNERLLELTQDNREKDDALREKDEHIGKLDSELQRVIDAKDEQIEETRSALASRDVELEGMRDSRSWRLTRPLRWAERRLRFRG